MTDVNNSSNNPGAKESKGSEKPEGKPAEKPEDESKTNVDPSEQARRDQQSKKDKALAEKDDSNERLSFLEARENERMRDSFVNDLLTSEADKYPDVKANDPLFKYATSEEEVVEIAKEIQNKVKTAEQEALSKVQAEPDQGLTDEEIAEKEKVMEEETQKTGKSNFIPFLSNVQRRKR